MVLGREAIFAAEDLRDETIDVPEWGGKVRVRALTGAERDQYEQSITTNRGGTVTMNLANARAKLVALTVIDDDGQRLFSDTDAAELGNKSAVALNRVFESAQRLSGLTGEDVEALTKDLEDGPAAGPSSASPKP